MSSPAAWTKPHRTDAAVRLKNSTLALVGLCTATTLLPTPSPASALLTVALRRDVSDFAWAFSILQTIVLGILLMSLTQSALALRYPPPPLASARPQAQPIAPLASSTPLPTPRRLVAADSKVATPSVQRPFSSSVSSSLGPGPYAVSPVSTPSRTLQYSLSPAQAPFDTSISSLGDVSLSLSVPPSPSPANSSPMAAFRNMRPPSAGRPLDSSFFRRLDRSGPVFAQADE